MPAPGASPIHDRGDFHGEGRLSHAAGSRRQVSSAAASVEFSEGFGKQLDNQDANQ
jgi:hypothetical protein